jgi:hypothetical protein
MGHPVCDLAGRLCEDAAAMITAHDLPLDPFPPEAGNDKRLTTWYAQGQSDGLGDRLLMFDNTNAPSWEILRFKAALAHEPRFEAALRERVEQLASFQHDAFPMVRPIKRLGHDDGLAVVSTYSGGAALSEALKRPRSADFALRLIRQLIPALAALQRVGPGVSHGAITADRIILSAEGRLVIREHMVGSAIGSLNWEGPRLWSEFGVLVPHADQVTIDARTDVAQLALIALSLMVGRRLGPDEYPDKIRDLLDELTRKNHMHNLPKFQLLRHWLERALQLSEKPFATAQDAQAGLADLQDSTSPVDQRTEQPRRPAPKEPPVKGEAVPPPMWSAARGLPAPVGPTAKEPLSGADHAGTLARQPLTKAPERAVRMWRGITVPATRWISVALAVVVIVEAVVIGRLLWTPSAPPAVEGRPVASAPSPAPQVQPIEQPPVVAPVPLVAATATTVDPKLPEIRALQPPAPAVRSGGFRISAPIELHVLDGERVIGSTADSPIMTTAGRRELDFVNSVIGYRVRQSVDVRAGQIVTVTVPVPNGVLNINAQPWAAVWIDGNSLGETPIGNLSVVPGEHEIVFRHPQLGERREKTIVRSGVETRVSANLQR